MSYSLLWTQSIEHAFSNAWMLVASFIPSLIAAIIVLLVGLFIASLFRLVVERFISAIKLDAALKRMGIAEFAQRGGFSLNSGVFIGGIVYWFFVIVLVLAASDILGLWGLSSFLSQVLLFLPNIIVAAFIVLIAVIAGNFLRSLVRGSVKGAKLHAAHFLGTLVWWVTVIFGILASLLQLGVATQIVESIIMGAIAMISLAGGIAFGLGGKDYAADLLKKLRERVE
ncbi:MAG: hypothetical protein WC099_00265 [Candidatus Paceibacterota bacterium]